MPDGFFENFAISGGVVESETLKLHESNGVMFRPHRVVALVGATGTKYPFCGTFASQERPRL